MTAAGCTMCPDPYDYTGPVPNGSAPQNDFRARSNGILPIGASPKPYPPIVKAAPARQPTPADTEPDDPTDGTPQVAEAEDDLLRLSAEESTEPSTRDEATAGQAAESAATTGATGAESPIDEIASSIPEIVAAEDTGSHSAPVAEVDVPAGSQPLVKTAAEPILRETPGWRSRR